MNEINSDIEKWIDDYSKRYTYYKDAALRFERLLNDLLNSNNIKYHVIESRVKDITSFRNKIERKKYCNPMKDVTDLVGIRIILYFQEDVEKVANLIEREFEIDKDNSVDKGKLLKLNEFGYQSIHYVAGLSYERKMLSEWRGFRKTKIEIQLRTVLQHSWATISHIVEYKKNHDIPSALRRKLYRLASLIELADEEFQGINKEKYVIEEEIKNSSLKDLQSSELNIVTLREYLRNSEHVKKLNIIANNLELNMHNEEEIDNHYSEIIWHSNRMNIKNIEGFDSFLSEMSDEYYDILKFQFKDKKDWGTSTSFIILLFLVSADADNLDPFDLEELGWDYDVAERFLKKALEYKNK
ncbi:GTP pyrophosphokinase [Aneurinibacillus aneurinilyticus]|uniref:GTP pyrophosphokinase n=1 Tax=Aneurinibacillus aneurinilyticus TaxID=1391 RepID=UPI003525ABAF